MALPCSQGTYKSTPTGRQITVTIPASFLSTAHHYALDVSSGGVPSNATDFIVMQAVDMTSVCSNNNPQPTGVAIADQLKNGPFSPIAVVTNSNCNNISTIDINRPVRPSVTSFKQFPWYDSSGCCGEPAPWPRVVANNGSGNAVHRESSDEYSARGCGHYRDIIRPGLPSNEATGAAIVANTNQKPSP